MWDHLAEYFKDFRGPCGYMSVDVMSVFFSVSFCVYFAFSLCLSLFLSLPLPFSVSPSLSVSLSPAVPLPLRLPTPLSLSFSVFTISSNVVMCVVWEASVKHSAMI